MSLSPCHECKNQVSSDAKHCPSCGAKQDRPVSKLGLLLAILLGVSVFQCTRPESKTVPTKTPEEIAAEEAQAKASRARYSFAAEFVKAIQTTLRDPDSLVVETLLVNEDATTGCASYRAKNGFGGMNREFVVIDKGKAKKTTEAWNKVCTKKMYDMMYSVK